MESSIRCRYAVLSPHNPLFSYHIPLLPIFTRLSYSDAGVGFDASVLYIWPRHLPGLLHDPGIKQLLASDQLILVLWDHFSLFAGWPYLDMMVANSHASLSYWGRHARLFISDTDEFLVPTKPRTTLADMVAPGGCLAGFSACNAFFERALFPSIPLLNESAVWHGNPLAPHPLTYYGVMTPLSPVYPKSMVDPNAVFPMSVHSSLVCMGNWTVADGASIDKAASPCSTPAPCMDVAETCGFTVHVVNMHDKRMSANALNASITFKPEWLWMLHS